jgi:hypothetical protein
MWVWESPPIAGLKLLRVLYEIKDADRKVIMWHLSVTDLPDFGIL